MKIKRFQTDFSLWLRISLVLFLISLFVFQIDVKGDSMSPVAWLGQVIRVTFEGDFRGVFGLGFTLILFGAIPSKG